MLTTILWETLLKLTFISAVTKKKKKPKPIADTITPWCKAALQRLFLVWGSVFAFQKDLPWYSSCNHLSQYVLFYFKQFKFQSKEIKPVNPKKKSTLNTHWKDWCWSWSSNTLSTWSLEKTLLLGKTKGKRRRGQQRMIWLDSITDSRHEPGQTLGDSKGQGGLACCSLWGCKQ